MLFLLGKSFFDLSLFLGSSNLFIVITFGRSFLHPHHFGELALHLSCLLGLLVSLLVLRDHLLDDGREELRELFLSEALQFVFDVIQFLVKVTKLVSEVFLRDLVAADVLRKEDQLGRVVLSLPESIDAVLERLDLNDFLPVTKLDSSLKFLRERLRDDRNEQVEEKNKVKDGAKEPYEPLAFLVELKVAIEFTKGGCVRFLPRDHIPLHVSLVGACVLRKYSRLKIFSNHEDLLDGGEGIGEGNDTDDEDHHETHHVVDAGRYHSDEPREGGNRLQVEQEAEPDGEGGPRLHRPEGHLSCVIVEHVEQNQDWGDDVRNLSYRG